MKILVKKIKSWAQHKNQWRYSKDKTNYSIGGYNPSP